MKKIIFLIWALLSSASFATDLNELIVCLGNEEDLIHKKKIGGPIYKLNQKLISEIISDDSIKVKDNYVEEICKGTGNLTPSVRFLKLLLTKRDSIFISHGTANYTTSQTKIKIDHILNTTQEIFLSYLSYLRNLAPTSSCLKENIPYISEIITNYKYLQEEMKGEDLLLESKKIEIIFSKLSKLDQIFKQCKKKAKSNRKK